MAIFPDPKKQRWSGIHPGKYFGDIAGAWNIDLEKSQGKIVSADLLKVVTDNATLTSFSIPQHFLLTDADTTNRWWALTETAMLKNASSSPTGAFSADAISSSPTSNISDMIVHERASAHDRMVVSTFTNLYLLSNGSWNTSWWQSTLAQSTLVSGQHPMARYNRLLAIVDSNVLHTIDSLDFVSNSRIAFDAVLTGVSIYASADGFWVGLKNRNGGSGAIAFWDGFSNTYNSIYPIEGTPISGFIVDGIPYFVLDNGIITKFNGKTFVDFAQFPCYEENLLLDIPTTQHTATVDGRIAYINLNQPLGSTRMRGGTWCFDADTGNLYHRYSLSQTRVSSDTTMLTTLGSSVDFTNTGVVIAPATSGTSPTVNGAAASGTATTVSSVTVSTTVPSGSNQILIVNVMSVSGAVTGVTYGGIAMTQASTGSDKFNWSVYYLVAPTAGTANVVVSMSISSSNIAVSAVTVQGASQSSPINLANSRNTTSTSAYVTFSTVTDNCLLLTSVMSQNATHTQNTGQTQLINIQTAFPFRFSLSWKFVNLYPDFGQSRINGTNVGAIVRTYTPSVKFLVSGNIWSDYNQTSLNLISVPQTPSTNRARFATSLVPAAEVSDYWYNIWLRFRKFVGSYSIVTKYRVTQGLLLSTTLAPLDATATWVTQTTFTATVPTGIVVGQEVEILSGDNAGCTFHISALSGTPDGSTPLTVTIDEAAPAASITHSLVRFDDWLKATGNGTTGDNSASNPITDTTISYARQLLGGPTAVSGSTLQLKLELRGAQVEIEQIRTDEEMQVEANL